jgi:hypothetical protein
MAGIKLYFFVKIMNIYNNLLDLTNRYTDNILDFYDYFKSYFSGEHDKWIFIPNHSLPISINNLYNSSTSTWIYDNNRCCLYLNSDVDKCTAKFSWLSAKLRVKYLEIRDNTDNKEVFWQSEFEYDIDKFLENFKLKTHEEIVPTLQTIYLIWCAHTKHWFPGNSFVEFEIIDSDGEEKKLNIRDDNDCLTIQHNKICVIIHSSEGEASYTTSQRPRLPSYASAHRPSDASNDHAPVLVPVDDTVNNKED